ncbi:MAG: single-stranded DNA-binding protein [Clostridiales bacterium]|nr:single-stranded DNA-binding protein [Clostridiales bacterium]
MVIVNQVIFIGRVVENPILETTDDGKEKVNVTISNSRHYKNSDGIYETDTIDCCLYNQLAKTTYENCKKGDLIAIKGCLTSEIDENGKRNLIVLTEKLSFLSRNINKNKEQSNEER